MPRDGNYLNTGFISAEISDENGIYPENPVITIELEAAFVAYGMLVRFRNVAPEEFKIRTYNAGVKVEEWTVSDPELVYETQEQMQLLTGWRLFLPGGILIAG